MAAKVGMESEMVIEMKYELVKMKQARASLLSQYKAYGETTRGANAFEEAILIMTSEIKAVEGDIACLENN